MMKIKIRPRVSFTPVDKSIDPFKGPFYKQSMWPFIRIQDNKKTH